MQSCFRILDVFAQDASIVERIQYNVDCRTCSYKQTDRQTHTFIHNLSRQFQQIGHRSQV